MRTSADAALALFSLALLSLSGFAAPSSGAASTASGGPGALSVTVVPPQLPADGGAYPAVVVSLLTAAGKPALALTDTTVFLSSSQQSVGSVTPQVVIKAGRNYQVANFSTTTTPGTSTITASATGLTSGSGSVSVVAPSPFALKIFAQPSPLPVMSPGRLVITLIDHAGNPARAPSDIPVTVASSNTTVLSAEQSAVIKAGQIFAVSSIKAGSTPGSADLTVSSQGIKSDMATVMVAAAVPPAGLTLFVSPNPAIADGSSYNSVVVALSGANGGPSIAGSSVQVTLTTADATVGNVTKSITIPAGSSYAVATFSSTYFVGSTTLTASAQNLASANVPVQTSVGSVPSQLATFVAPSSTVQAQGGKDALLVVQLQDPTAAPAKARSDIKVVVTASNASLFGEPMVVTIRTGQDYALAYLTAQNPGTSALTASAGGLASSSVTLSVVSAPVSLALAASSQAVVLGDSTIMTLNAAYFGMPLPNANVTFSSSSGGLTPRSGTTDQNGHVTTIFTPGQTGASTVTATLFSPLVGNRTAAATVLVISAGTPGQSKNPGGSLNLLVVVLPVVIVLVFLGALVFMVRRTLKARREAEGRSGEEGAEASSQNPKS